MATNGILDITTEEYMGQDPEMQIDQNEMTDIIWKKNYRRIKR